MSGLWAVIPAYNEEKTIGDTVRAVTSLPGLEECLVIDDGSTDETYSIARAAGARIWRLPFNQGKGQALNAASPMVDGDLILLLDGDLGSSAREAAKLLKPIRQGKADLVIAQFSRNPQRGFGLVKGTAAAGSKFLGGVDLQAPLSGQRAMTRKVWDHLLPFAGGYGAELSANIKAGRLGFKILEVAVDMTHNYTGRDWVGFRHRGRQLTDVLRVLARELVPGS